MIGMTLRTPQTGPEGQQVRKVYVEEGCRIAQELYFAITLDRETGRVTSSPPPTAAWTSRRSRHRTPGADPEGARSTR